MLYKLLTIIIMFILGISILRTPVITLEIIFNQLIIIHYTIYYDARR